MLAKCTALLTKRLAGMPCYCDLPPSHRSRSNVLVPSMVGGQMRLALEYRVSQGFSRL